MFTNNFCKFCSLLNVHRLMLYSSESLFDRITIKVSRETIFVLASKIYKEICKNSSIVFLYWRHQIFSIFSLRGILVCSLKMLVLFSRRILKYRLISFRKAMQLYQVSLFVFEPVFVGSSGKCLWLLLKIK